MASSEREALTLRQDDARAETVAVEPDPAPRGAPEKTWMQRFRGRLAAVATPVALMTSFVAMQADATQPDLPKKPDRPAAGGKPPPELKGAPDPFAEWGGKEAMMKKLVTQNPKIQDETLDALAKNPAAVKQAARELAGHLRHFHPWDEPRCKRLVDILHAAGPDTYHELYPALVAMEEDMCWPGFRQHAKDLKGGIAKKTSADAAPRLIELMEGDYNWSAWQRYNVHALSAFEQLDPNEGRKAAPQLLKFLREKRIGATTISGATNRVRFDESSIAATVGKIAGPDLMPQLAEMLGDSGENAKENVECAMHALSNAPISAMTPEVLTAVRPHFAKGPHRSAAKTIFYRASKSAALRKDLLPFFLENLPDGNTNAVPEFRDPLLDSSPDVRDFLWETAHAGGKSKGTAQKLLILQSRGSGGTPLGDQGEKWAAGFHSEREKNPDASEEGWDAAMSYVVTHELSNRAKTADKAAEAAKDELRRKGVDYEIAKLGAEDPDRAHMAFVRLCILKEGAGAPLDKYLARKETGDQLYKSPDMLRHFFAGHRTTFDSWYAAEKAKYGATAQSIVVSAIAGGRLGDPAVEAFLRAELKEAPDEASRGRIQEWLDFRAAKLSGR